MTRSGYREAGRAGRSNKRASPLLAALNLVLALGATVSSTVAQNTVPPALLNNSRPSQGDQIRFCIDQFSPGADFNTAVSQAIADTLLVEAKFAPAPSGFPLDGQGYFDELQLVMNTECDVLVGVSLEPDTGESPFPDWATVTRPFAKVPFVLVAKNPDYTALKDIPFGKRVGTTMGSAGQGVMIAYIGQQAPDKRWVQLPYADSKLMLKRLLDGTIDGMVIWQPALNEITDHNPGALGLKIIPMDPLPPVYALVGDLVSVRDSYLRSQIDTAIGSLIADGTIANLMQQYGYMGTPGP